MEKQQQTKEGIKKLWAKYQAQMMYFIQDRVIQRVLAGWEFDKAVRNEGLIPIKHPYPTAQIREMFKSGELESIKKVYSNKAEDMTPEAAAQMGVDLAEPGGDKTVVYEKGADSFIPRPKNR